MAGRALCLLLLFLAADAVHAQSARPNFILLMSDDTGWGDVSYNNVSSRVHQPGAGGETYVVNPPRTPELDAMSKSENSILFHRFYAGSAVCSPTRSSALTGRTSTRECIDGAEGCGQAPAWSCGDSLPLSPRTFTIAEAAKKKGYATLHIGKVRAPALACCPPPHLTPVGVTVAPRQLFPKARGHEKRLGQQQVARFLAAHPRL